jgi:cardiolipin synthase
VFQAHYLYPYHKIQSLRPLALKNSAPDYLRHNKVELIQGGRDYFTLLESMIDEAEKSIYIQTYIFDEDETGNKVADALLRAAKRQVKVYMLLDAYGSQHLSRDFVKKLTEAGIFLRRFKPAFKSKHFYLGRRLHHKVVVIDSWRCTVAGLNISNRYNDTPEAAAWLDWALYAEGEVAPALEEICQSRLRLRNRKASPIEAYQLPKTQCLVRIRVNDALRRKRQIYNSYLELFKEASSSMIIMSAYFLPGKQFRKKIADAAKRGVKVKVVLTANADIFMIKYAERYIYRWLFKNNIEVYEYQNSVLHAKIAVRDGEWMTGGSYNLNNLSAFASIELNLDVKDKKFAQLVQDKLEGIIAKDCLRITEKKFNKTANFFTRAAHFGAYEVFRFLFFLSTKQKGDF